MLEKPKLFVERREVWVVVGFFLVLLVARLGWLYGEYREFILKPFYFTQAEVIEQYTTTREGERYTLSHFYAPALDLHFVSRIYVDEPLVGRSVRLKLFPSERIGFVDYLRRAYIPAKINRIYPSKASTLSTLSDAIASQHENPTMQRFYQAIFLATPLPKELRGQIATLGVSHLVALSGLHLAILSLMLFGLLRPLYRGLQQRFFPYRFEMMDVGLVVLLILGGYLYMVGMPPSLLRSYVMMVLGWLMLLLGVELVSFGFLGVTLMGILVLFPKLLFSVAFWFSMAGVFYIFLLLKYFEGLGRWWMSLLISVGLFVLMLPIVHLIFPLVSPWQLLSPWLSLVFTFFYPLSLGLHLLGIGGVLDGGLMALFSLESASREVLLGGWWGVGYLLLSLGAVYSRWLFWLLVGVALLGMGAMFMPFMLS